MTKHKYVGLDVHQATTSIAVLDSKGKLLSQSTHPNLFSGNSRFHQRCLRLDPLDLRRRHLGGLAL